MSDSINDAIAADRDTALVFERESTIDIARHSTLTTAEAGWIGRDAILMTGINALFYVASSLPPYVFAP